MLPAAYLLDKNDKVIERMGGIPPHAVVGSGSPLFSAGLVCGQCSCRALSGDCTGCQLATSDVGLSAGFIEYVRPKARGQQMRNLAKKRFEGQNQHNIGVKPFIFGR